MSIGFRKIFEPGSRELVGILAVITGDNSVTTVSRDHDGPSGSLRDDEPLGARIAD